MVRRSGPLTVHFYPRPPRGGRQTKLIVSPPVQWISTHALREEGDVRVLYAAR